MPDLANLDQALRDILIECGVITHRLPMTLDHPVLQAMRRAYRLAESKEELARMTQQNNLAAQTPMDVRCKRGWQGKSDKLLSGMGTGYLFCPGCTTRFAPYPLAKNKSPQRHAQWRIKP